ncbi:MAG: AMP-binding protein [Rhodospirillaceae bacterium]|jgi:bile acid-coenzyme A ligase|nr:AMP-binding protein [Rhodospirillaceae bacterium]MBT5895882.1 AMP-binding protein [Rhodospirillaceae bacterium]MBT6429456.1 AMP-binding protein [Rhodospirillaceae bacterium]MBT7758144.1 AMP-binding protein [Rhodospirillaceae bacterium]
MSEVSLSRVLAFWAERDPDRPALTYEGVTLSRVELEARTNRLARAYGELGVKADDYVTIALPNGIEFVEAVFATWKLGATPQPVSYRLPDHERQQIVELAEPSLVVGAPASAHPGTVCVEPGFLPDADLSHAPLPEMTAKYWKAMTSGGSTGRPKLIVSKDPAAVDPMEERLGLKTEKVCLIPGPLYHNGPFSLGMIALQMGHHLIITSRFDAAQTLELIDGHGVNLLYLVPTMMQRMWRLPQKQRDGYNVGSLELVWHMAAPCPAWLKEVFIEWFGGDVLMELYGGTEAQGFTTLSGTEWLQHRGSVGKLGEGFQIKIVDDDGKTLPTGEVGEVFLLPDTGQGTTYFYIGAEAKSVDGGWESLGDMGYLDDDGYLYLTDRRSDMILSGGANIYPAEVEAAIDLYPGVRSSAVIGLPDEDMGNLVHAVVDVPAQDLNAETLLAHLGEHLVRYKIPRTIEFVAEPLRDDAGKVRRRALRDARIQERDARIDGQ